MNSTKVTAVASLFLGMCLGFGIAWKLLEKKYEAIAQEEIDSVKEIYSKKESAGRADSQLNINDPDGTETFDRMDYNEYLKQTERYSPIDYHALSSSVENIRDQIENMPYVISPENFGELEDYDKVTLTHYADGVLADIHDNKISDIENCVGDDYANHFGDYEDDAIHIRNETRKIDYEILYDERDYSDIISDKPYLDIQEE